jgi:3-oxoacyl-[acyl-carrier protein] reductase
MLDNKNAVIYGAGGSVGGAVARAFAREGARVFLAGRTLAKVEAVAGEIRSAGGLAEPAEVNALDEAAVERHADEVGRIDISFNLTSHPWKHGTPLPEMEVDDFTGEIDSVMRSQFLTTRAAARRMIPRGSGVLLFFGGDGDPMRDYYIGATQVAFTAVEQLRRQLAAELGRHGIRTVTLRTGGVPETIPGADEIERTIVSQTTLGRAATLDDVGNAAVFAASDRGRTMTAATINVSCGALID